MSYVKIFTDGGCRSVGGKRVASAACWNPSLKSGYVSNVPGEQTNQRAELTAILLALDSYEDEDEMMILSDSDYSIKSLTEWCGRWMKNGWVSSKNEPVKNRDLIESCLAAMKGRKVSFTHVYGHQKGDDENSVGNNKADEIASAYIVGSMTKNVVEMHYD